MTTIIQTALPVPLPRQFDYDCEQLPAVGARVRVPFGNRELVGVCLGEASAPDDSFQRKAVLEVIDDEPLWPRPIWRLLEWAADYYHHPLGDVIQNAMPVLLRQGERASYQATTRYQVTEQGAQISPNDLKRAVQQQRLLAALQQQPLLSRDIRMQEFSPSALKALQDKGWVEAVEHIPAAVQSWSLKIAAEPLQLNPEQALAVAAIGAAKQHQTYLLEGVTGSGKTEVYLQAMADVLRRGQQVLMLVPEIGLTPQTLKRFQQRFDVPIVMLHSALTDRERLDAWLDARAGSAAIIIGTRSAIFTPCKALGMIIVDEEHDASLKQQDGFRYHARDLAVMRGHEEQVPVILGSATPSFETLNNALNKRYAHLQLSRRAGQAKPARHVVMDIKNLPLKAGLSQPLLGLMREHLDAGQQVLLFLNRRGFAPALLCHECGWLAQCRRCDAYYTVHQGSKQLQCHHCGAQQPIPRQCHDCGSTQLIGRGVGTEQLEQLLQEQFPDYPVLRIDRDSTRKKGSLQQHLQDAHDNKYPILVGTQMLAKGHHFPDVTLAALLDVDGALYSADFRAAERLGQMFTQVAGRAGRASKPGTVVLQTHHPEHELIQDLINNGYGHFAQSALRERQLTHLPPFSQHALFRAEANNADAVIAALEAIATLFPQRDDVIVLGPIPAVMERRAGRYRYQLLIQTQQRAMRAQLLRYVLPQLEKLPQLRKVRWSLDIDPQDFS
ncbi:primosomal protein N' [Pseudidiomarina marina]|uniref:Replication restart protein PriA n=1 Tax=Pseudidiomarina marina TaxID=502366 RepID=A0A432YE24_9GAMM|nr:primosomal protein N' [Pseudidiomarina marina]RUO59163.1 primosomal protein N' [Pseudidiomarina marina]